MKHVRALYIVRYIELEERRFVEEEAGKTWIKLLLRSPYIQVLSYETIH